MPCLPSSAKGVVVLEEQILEYGGYSAARGRCHVIVTRAEQRALVGDPQDNPGTSVTNAIEQIAFDLQRTAGVDVMEGELFQYVPWDVRLRRPLVTRVEFRGDAWSMPVCTPIEEHDGFVRGALSIVHRYQPYALSEMRGVKIINRITRLRIESPLRDDVYERISQIGTIEHISQRRVFYVDVAAESDRAALTAARQSLAPAIPPESVQVTTPNAPLDNPGGLPG